MKKYILLSTLLFALVFTSFGQSTIYPRYGEFSKIDISSHAIVYLRQDSVCSVRIEGNYVRTDEAMVSGSTLLINSSNGSIFYVSMPKIDRILISGKGEILGQSRITQDKLDLAIIGDGKITLDANVKDIDASISGIGKIVLSGTAENARFSIPGSAKIDAIDLRVQNCDANISGIGKISVDVVDQLNSNISGNGTISYKNPPAHSNDNVTGMGKIKPITDSQSSGGSQDTTRLMFGERQIWIIGKKDTTKNCENDARPFWAGMELGMCSFMDAGGKFSLSDGKEGFETNLIKSISFSLNFYQKNWELGHSNVWFFTGLGFKWENYRFDADVNLTKGEYTNAVHVTSPGQSFLKSKLVVSYLTAPVMFEVLTSRKQSRAFHLGAGAILGLRLGSHTKQKIDDNGHVYKQKDHDDFNLNPVKYGARVNIGYGNFNLYAEYDASTFFKDKKGPELYPVNVGVTVVGF